MSAAVYRNVSDANTIVQQARHVLGALTSHMHHTGGATRGLILDVIGTADALLEKACGELDAAEMPLFDAQRTEQDAENELKMQAFTDHIAKFDDKERKKTARRRVKATAGK